MRSRPRLCAGVPFVVTVMLLASTSPAEASDEVAVSSDEFKLVVFENRERGVRMAYPAGWFVVEQTDQSPYVVTIKPVPIDADLNAPASIIMELFKYYHASSALGFEQRALSRRLIDRYLQVFERNGGIVFTQKPMKVQGAEGCLAEVEGIDPTSWAADLTAGPRPSTRPGFRWQGDVAEAMRLPIELYRKTGALYPMMLLVAARDDVLAALLCQAPPKEFDGYRTLMQYLAQRVEFFSSDPAPPDNVMLDRQTSAWEKEAIDAMHAGDSEACLQQFHRARRVNPGNAMHALSYGQALSLMAEHTTKEDAATLLAHAEHELQAAVRLSETWADPDSVGFFTSQALYLLSGIAEQRGDRQLAKRLLQRAVAAYPHPKAQEALKRYPD